MAGTKKRSKKTSSTRATKPEQPDAIEQAQRTARLNARAQVENQLHGMNDPAAFSVLEKLRAEWSKEDSAASVSGEITFSIYEDDAGEHRWRATASNGQIMADSGEGYSSPANARRAQARFIELVKGLSA